jgi:hypothetical protein
MIRGVNKFGSTSSSGQTQIQTQAQAATPQIDPSSFLAKSGENFDARNARLTNLASPIQPSDAVTMEYFQSNMAVTPASPTTARRTVRFQYSGNKWITGFAGLTQHKFSAPGKILKISVLSHLPSDNFQVRFHVKSFVLLVNKNKGEVLSQKKFDLKPIPFQIGDAISLSDEGKIPFGNHVIDVWIESQ